MECNKKCIAYVDGKCCVEKCKGAVTMILDLSERTLETRIDLYEMATQSFQSHGYWKEYDGLIPVCSVCGRTHKLFVRCPDKCPNCGAIMDGDKND